MFILADSLNFYPKNVEIYTGRTTQGNSPQEMVLRVSSNIPKGHVLVGDNYHTTLSLSNQLLERGIRYFGTEKIEGRSPK